MNKGTIIGVLIAVLVLGGIGGGIWMATRPTTQPGPAVDTGTNLAAPTPVSTSPTTEDEGITMEEATGEVKEFDVAGSNFRFTPATITVKKGETVRINFKSSGAMLHDFKIDEFDVATSQLGDEETETIEFVADKSGTFEYYCSVGNHRAMGMVGKLIVE